MSNLNPQAVELNNTIKSVNPAVYEMLSKKGKGIFFPAKGILGQAAAAKGKKINATIGIALEDNGEPLGLDCVKDLFDIDAKNSLFEEGGVLFAHGFDGIRKKFHVREFESELSSYFSSNYSLCVSSGTADVQGVNSRCILQPCRWLSSNHHPFSCHEQEI